MKYIILLSALGLFSSVFSQTDFLGFYYDYPWSQSYHHGVQGFRVEPSGIKQAQLELIGVEGVDQSKLENLLYSRVFMFDNNGVCDSTYKIGGKSGFPDSYNPAFMRPHYRIGRTLDERGRLIYEVKVDKYTKEIGDTVFLAKYEGDKIVWLRNKVDFTFSGFSNINHSIIEFKYDSIERLSQVIFIDDLNPFNSNSFDTTRVVNVFLYDDEELYSSNDTVVFKRSQGGIWYENMKSSQGYYEFDDNGNPTKKFILMDGKPILIFTTKYNSRNQLTEFSITNHCIPSIYARDLILIPIDESEREYMRNIFNSGAYKDDNIWLQVEQFDDEVLSNGTSWDGVDVSKVQSSNILKYEYDENGRLTKKYGNDFEKKDNWLLMEERLSYDSRNNWTEIKRPIYVDYNGDFNNLGHFKRTISYY